MQSLSQVARDLNTKKLFKSYGFSVGERRITVTREREERLKELELKYQEFIKTDSGKKWLDDCKSRNNGQTGDCGDYLYDFYPEVLM